MKNKTVELTREELIANLRSSDNKSFSGSTNAKDYAISDDDIDSFGNYDSLKKMLNNVKAYNTMLDQKITLINDQLTAAIPFTRENLYLFCAFTGSGKSTVAANITHPLWKQGKRTLVISNEESEQDVIFRIACLELGLNFNDYKKGKMDPKDQVRALALFPKITRQVKVLDVNYKNGITTKIEGIKNALETLATKDYSCVLIDYYQLIQVSGLDKTKTRYDVLNDLRLWLGQYIKASPIPVVLFAQLYSHSKRGGAKDIDSRIKECSAIVEPATVIVEIVPNWDLKTSDFIIHKDRFGMAGHKITCSFEKGRYVGLTDDELVEREKNVKLEKAGERLDKFMANMSKEKKES